MPTFHVHNMRGIIRILSGGFLILHIRKHSQPNIILQLSIRAIKLKLKSHINM